LGRNYLGYRYIPTTVGNFIGKDGTATAVAAGTDGKISSGKIGLSMTY